MSSSRVSVVLVSLLVLAGCSSGKAAPPAGPTPATRTTTPATTPSTASDDQLANLDPCALLTPAELATVMHGTPKPTAGAPHTDGGITQATCDWNTDKEKVSVYVVSGLPADQLALSFAAKSNDAKGHTVDGLGDKAWVFSDIPADAEVDVLFGSVGFTVDVLTLSPPGDLQNKTIALAKAIGGRL